MKMMIDFDPYTILSIDPSSGNDTVLVPYINKVRETFSYGNMSYDRDRLRLAYDVLYDPLLRDMYDKK